MTYETRPSRITGLAQVWGRNSLGWDDKFAADIKYVTQRSLALDLRIIGRTFLAVLNRQGISAGGVATMHEFTRSPDHEPAVQ